MIAVLWMIAKEIPSFFINPFLYVFVMLVAMHYHRQILFERRLFHRRINQPGEQLLHSLVQGVWGGILASLLMMGFGVVVQPFDVWVLLGLSFLLSLFHIQYLCFAYAGGGYVVLASLVKLWPQGGTLPVLEWIWTPLLQVSIPSIIGMISVCHVVEAVLVGRNRGRGSSPIYMEGKRGRLVGAYQLQKFWLLPTFAVVPFSEGLSMPSWWPFVLAGVGTSFTFMVFPAIAGFANLSIASLPEDQARRSARSLFLFSALLLVFAFAAKLGPGLGLAAGLFALFGHEALIRLGRWKQGNQPPIFVQLGQGAVVLAVLPDTPAEKMGIRTGDVILKVNGVAISESEELYPALQVNSAFCKMEVRNVEGHIKYLQRAIYQGEHHQLGLILAPDEQTPYYVDMKPVNIVDLIRQQIDRGA